MNFCGIALNTAKAGRKDALLAAARDHAEALRRQPGCLAAYVLDQRDSLGQVSISIFESEEAFHKALAATRPVIAAHRLESLLDGTTDFRFFDVR